MGTINGDVYRLGKQIKATQPDMTSAPRALWAALDEAAKNGLRLKFIAFPGEKEGNYTNLVIGRRGNEWREPDHFIFGWYSGREGAYFRSIDENELPEKLRRIADSVENRRKDDLRLDIFQNWLLGLMLLSLVACAAAYTRGYHIPLAGSVHVLGIILPATAAITLASWLISALRFKSVWKKDDISWTTRSIRAAYQN